MCCGNNKGLLKLLITFVTVKLLAKTAYILVLLFDCFEPYNVCLFIDTKIIHCILCRLVDLIQTRLPSIAEIN